ncbi:MAG: carbohydrate ABC transporter permease [Chloroflexi bacterium]|nr:carbohydrate ABC transporter permease [Chloroflexota bacterium]
MRTAQGAAAASRRRTLALASRRLSRLLLFIPLGVVTAILLGPFVWTLMMSFRLTNEINNNPYGLPIPFHTYNYTYALLPAKPDLLAMGEAVGIWPEATAAWLDRAGLENGGFGFGTYILNSILVVGPALVIVTVVTTMASYAFGRPRYDFPGRGMVFIFVFLSMFFPPQITLLSLFQLTVTYDIYNTRWALMLVYPATAIAFNTYLLRAFFAQIPTEIEDAARIDGCSDWGMYWRVMLPIARPAVATTLVFNFINFWNEFLYALTLVTKPELNTIPLASWRWVGEYYLDVGGLAAGLVVSILPIVVLYLALSEQFMRGMTAGAVKG